MVSSSICGSIWAQYAWPLATTPSRRNRGTSSGWTTWMWAMWCRWSLGPFAARAASTASSALRTARSPMACRCTWKPWRSSSVTAAASRSRSTYDSPWLSVCPPQPSQ